MEETGLPAATSGVVEGADFEAAGLRDAIAGVGAGSGVAFESATPGVTVGAVDRKGDGIGLDGMTVAIDCGVSCALVPQSGSFQKGTRSRAARSL